MTVGYFKSCNLIVYVMIIVFDTAMVGSCLIAGLQKVTLLFFGGEHSKIKLWEFQLTLWDFIF